MVRCVLPVILLSGICSADPAPCAPGDTVVSGSFGPLPEPMLTSGLTCSEAGLTFENFNVQVDQSLNPVPSWGITLGSQTQGSTLSFIYPEIPGDDVFVLDFTVSGNLTGIDLETGNNMSVEEAVCIAPFNGALCPVQSTEMAGTANAGEVFLAVSPLPDGLYYVDAEVTNGSGFANILSTPGTSATPASAAPEPEAIWVAGGVLLLLGAVGKTKVQIGRK